MAPHSSTLAWKTPWTEEPGGLQSMGSRRVGHDWATSISLFTFMHWRRKWQPTPVFLPGESQGQGAWWAAVYGVAQSRTRLKRRSSSKFPRILSHAWFQIELAIKLMYSRFGRNRFVFFFFKCFALWWKASGSVMAGMWLSLSCWLALLVLGQHLDLKLPWFQLGHLLLLLWVLGQVCVQLRGKDTSSPAGHLNCWGWRQWKTDVSSSLFLFSPTSCPILLSNYWQV